MRLCIALVIAVASVTASPSCPPVFVPQGNSCVCADWPNRMVICDEDSPTASMQMGYCMTYDYETGEVRAGSCTNTVFRNDYYESYYPLPTNASDLNDQVCGPSNSKGLLCGECQDGFAVPALWTFFCLNCTGASNGWIKFVAAQYLPLTVIFGLIVIFAINLVSRPINSFISFAQVFALAPPLIYIVMYAKLHDSSTLSTRINSVDRSPGTVAITFYDAWSLNFSPRAYSPFFSLTNHLTRFNGMSLEYFKAFYPLVLIVLLYVGIKLYNWNFRPVVYCWKPFIKFSICFRRIVL